jgi:hypothetical protein
MKRYVQKKIDGEWRLVELTRPVQGDFLGGIVIMEDIKPFVANATADGPQLIGSRSSLRRYMANNGLVQFEPGMQQDNERNRQLEAQRNNSERREQLISIVNR